MEDACMINWFGGMRGAAQQALLVLDVECLSITDQRNSHFDCESNTSRWRFPIDRRRESLESQTLIHPSDQFEESEPE